MHRINQVRSCFLEKIKLAVHLGKLTKRKRWPTLIQLEILKMLLTDYNEVLRIIRKYLKKYIPENWKMDKILNDLLKLSQEDIHNLKQINNKQKD